MDWLILIVKGKAFADVGNVLKYNGNQGRLQGGGEWTQLASNLTKGERIIPRWHLWINIINFSVIVPNLVNIVLHKYYQNYSHQMPYFSFKMHQIEFRLGLRPINTPLRESSQCSLRPPIAGFGEEKGKGRRGNSGRKHEKREGERKGKGKEREGREWRDDFWSLGGSMPLKWKSLFTIQW